MLQLDPAGHAGGEAVGVIICQFILLIDTDQAFLFEQQVHVHIMLDILMAVVAEDHKVRIFKITVAADAFFQNGKFLIMLAQLFFHLRPVYTVIMPFAVQIAHLDVHQIRLAVIPDNIGRKCHRKEIQTAVFPLDIASVLPEIAVQQFL